ncbi:MAG: hypothetical protein CL908_19870 [Deltaproteobacteria bacterium]|nr:hypothetical protein [Deltaproteobacteria bacterium]
MSALILLAALATSAPPVGTVELQGAVLVRDVTFVEEIRCRGTEGRGSLRDLEVHVALPASDVRQTIDDLRCEPTPNRIVVDTHGNRYAVFTRKWLDAGRTWRVGFTCRTRSRGIAHGIDREAVGAEVPPGIRARYLRDGQRYGMHDPTLRKAAAEIAKRARGPVDHAFRINEYLRLRLTYLNDGRWEPAPRVLRNGHGSCSEYTFAFIALARLGGLPARWVGASALRSNANTYDDVLHHRWAEVWIAGHGWFPIDVSRNDGEDGFPVNRAFGRTSARLLVLMRGDGGKRAPLGWQYVASTRSKSLGDGRMTRTKRFTWTRPARAN